MIRNRKRLARTAQTVTSRLDRNEIGFSLCRVKATGTLVRGDVAMGTPRGVNIPTRCPKGSKLEVMVHTHPNGSVKPSKLDMQTARRFGVKAMCIASDTELKCHPVKRGRR